MCNTCLAHKEWRDAIASLAQNAVSSLPHLYTFHYMPRTHMILIRSERKDGIHLTQMNNVGDGMAEFLRELVEQANQVVERKGVEHAEASEPPQSISL